jgi:methanethiol S-methyltransferase
MRRVSFFTYGVICHALFLALYVYMAGFMGNFGVPKTIDSSPSGSVVGAIVVNLFLIALFAAQHSIMARPGFKRVWTRIVPKPIERSTYVLFSFIVTALLMWQWQAIDVTVWDVQYEPARYVLWGLFVAGWLAVPLVTFLINHFDLFGLRQVWLHLRGREYSSLPFRTPLAYKLVRHPLYLGWALFFWATPTMTLGHLLFAGTMTLYMAVAAIFEERDLVDHFGADYVEYQTRVPMFVPGLAAAPTKEPALVR